MTGCAPEYPVLAVTGGSIGGTFGGSLSSVSLARLISGVDAVGRDGDNFGSSSNALEPFRSVASV
jgi:hypothetical protein